MLRLHIAGLEANPDKIREILKETSDINVIFTLEQISSSGLALDAYVLPTLPPASFFGYRYKNLANRSFFGLYFEKIVESLAHGDFGFPLKHKLNNFGLSEHLDFIIELAQKGARPQSRELDLLISDFMALSLILKSLKNCNIQESLEAKFLTSCIRLLQIFTNQYDDFGLKENTLFKADEIKYLISVLQQKQLPEDRQAFCDEILIRLHNQNNKVYMHIGYVAFGLIQKKSDYDRALVMPYLSKMYQAGKGRCNLEQILNWQDKTSAVLASFTEEGKTQACWDVSFEDNSDTTWYEFYLWQTKIMVTELIRLREYNQAKNYLRAWINFLSDDLPKCRPDDSLEDSWVPLLFKEWLSISTSSSDEEMLCTTAMLALAVDEPHPPQAAQLMPAQPQQAAQPPQRARPDQPAQAAQNRDAPVFGRPVLQVVIQLEGQAPMAVPRLNVAPAQPQALTYNHINHFFLSCAEIIKKSNWENTLYLAKPYLSLIKLFLSVHEGTEQRLRLTQLWKSYLAQANILASLKKYGRELEEVVNTLDKLGSYIKGSTSFSVAIVRRFEKNEATIATQATEINALQQIIKTQHDEITKLQLEVSTLQQETKKASSLGLFTPPNPTPEALPKGQKTLDRWLISHKK